MQDEISKKALQLILGLMLGGAIAHGQAPSQFTDLLQTSTDYTCAGVVPCSTWPMPANPGPGGSYSDPTWGTTTNQLPLGPSSHNVIPTYSRVQAYNSNNTLLFVTEGGVGYQPIDLYNATTHTLINRISTTDGTYVNAYSGDANWSFTDPNRIYYIPWGTGVYGAAGLQLRYIDVSSCTTGSCVLTPVTVHTFSCTSDSYFPGGSGVTGTNIETGSGAQGGMFDSTDTYFSFTCDVSNTNGRGEIDFIRYNRTTDTVTTQEKWYQVCPGNVPSGCAVWTSVETPHPGYNMIRMNQHPDANYITVIWQCANNTWTQGCGTEAYGPTYNFLGVISGGNYHQDNGFDVNGVPTWVGVGGSTGYSMDYYSITVVNLTTLSTTAMTGRTIELPCNFAYAVACAGYPGAVFLNAKLSASHVSMTGTWGSVPGYALYSTMSLAGSAGAYVVDYPPATTLGTAVTVAGVNTVTPGSMTSIGVGTQQVIDFGNANVETVTVTGVTSSTFTATFAQTHTSAAPVSNLTVGDTGWGAMENLIVKIDTTAADQSNATYWRVGRAMSVRDTDYNAEPHTSVNRDFTEILWGSNWNTDNGADNAYYTELSSTPTAATPTFSPSAGAVINPTTVTASTSTSGCGSYIYFDTNSTPTTNTTTYSVTTAITLYAYVHGCPGYADSSIANASYTISGGGTSALKGSLGLSLGTQ